MYELSLPGGTPDAAETAAVWITTIVRKDYNILAPDAAAVMRKLIINAVHHTPPDQVIEVKAIPIVRGLRIEVRDPGTSSDGRQWQTVSKLARRFGGSNAEGGHLAWAELEVDTNPT